MEIPLFAGQGTASDAYAQAVEDIAISPAAATFLTACHQIFHTELSTLSASELSLSRVSLQEFSKRESLLAAPARYHHNPIISWGIFIAQAVRYVRFVEQAAIEDSSADASVSPFDRLLRRNGGAGILGFSAGTVMACVVAASGDLGSFLVHAVQAYRLVLWIGIRSQIYRATVLNATASRTICEDAPWSIVVIGLSRADAEKRICAFQTPSKSVYLTTVMYENAVTVSGHPDVLAEFCRSLGSEHLVHPTTLDMLYHSPVHADGVRREVLADIACRRIRFPDFADMKVPVWSTYSGEILAGTEGQSLVEVVVDMIITQPLNWDILVHKFAQTYKDCESHIQFLNFGPGNALPKTMARAIPARVSVKNVTRDVHVSAKQLPIAIVGMAVNVPGAPNADKLWDLLHNGISTVSEVPENRFKVSDYNDDKYPGRRMKAHTGNFLDNADQFDNAFFNISPREAKSMDPQQRILLHAAYEALEDSGYVPNATPSFDPARFGCYIGGVADDYVHNLRNEIDVYYTSGTVRAFLSGRVSFVMQLSGPSMVVDTACSSSTVALYQGARALVNGDCDAALVGGIALDTAPDLFIGLDRGHFLSPTGQCKPFDASADGYSRGEGCTAFVIKRLEDALAENDNIRGVIRGVEVNQSGLAPSITYPHVETQAALFRQVLANAGIEPNRVNVVEAHGAGTQAGDPSEVQSLRSVLAINRTSDNPLHLTSIKGNIGHLEAASGGASLAKLLLMLQYRRIPRQIGLETLNPAIAPLELDNVIINTVEAEWTPSHAGTSRVALLNNFGASGSNTALVLEEHIRSSAASSSVPEDMFFVFGLSAKTVPALEELRAKYIDWLSSSASASLSLPDISYTMTARRIIYRHRLAVSASSRDTLVEKLTRAVPVDIAPSRSVSSAKVVFVYSGNGGQYIAMGRRLYHESALFRSCIDECEAILARAGFPGMRADIILGSGDLKGLQEFEGYHTAIFSLEYGLTQLWASWGVVPDAVVGHSLGEYAALVTAGVLKLEDALLIVAHRVRLMVQKCAIDSTAMIAVNLSSEAIQDLLRPFADLKVVCYNSPVDCVVAGPVAQLEAFKTRLVTEVDCKSVVLPIPFACHSSAMAPLLNDLTALATCFTLRPPTIPVISNVFGDVVLPGNASIFTPEYFSRHCAEPVQFERGVRALLSQPDFGEVGAWIEIGPHTTCLPMLKANPAVGTKGSLLLASLRKQQPPFATLTGSLSQLYISRLSLQWRATFAHLPGVACVSLPSYPFANTRYWVPYRDAASASSPASAPALKLDVMARDLISKYPLLYSWAQHPSAANNFVALFESPIENLKDWIMGHRVCNMPITSGSLYCELVLAAVDLTGWRDNHNRVIRYIEYERPLLYNAALSVLVKITLREDTSLFTVSSRLSSTGEEFEHAHGEITYHLASQIADKFEETLHDITPRMDTILDPRGDTTEILSTSVAYDDIFSRVVQYAKPYHTIQTLTITADGTEGCATMQLPSNYSRGKFFVHPIWWDTLGHLSGLLANKQAEPNQAFICTHCGQVEVFSSLVDADKPYLMYVKNVWIPGEKAIVGEVYAIQVAEPRRIVAHMQGIYFRRFNLTTLTKNLVHAAGTLAPTPHPNAPTSFVPTGHQDHKPPHSPSSVDLTVLKLVCEACDLPMSSVNADTDLESMGIDSMMSIELLGGLRLAFPEAGLDTRFLHEFSTVGDIWRGVIAKLDALKTQNSLSNSKASVKSELSTQLDTSHRQIIEALQLDTVPTIIQASEAGTKHQVPLFLIHDGSGLINSYYNLSPLGRPVWGIHNPRFVRGQPWNGVIEMAAAYVEYILNVTSGPLLLGGWSFGGAVAYEIALQLAIQGIVVKGILLIDSPCPGPSNPPLPNSMLDAILSLDYRDRFSGLGALVRNQFSLNSPMLQRYSPCSKTKLDSPLVLLRSRQGFHPDGVTDIPKWFSDRSDPHTSVAGWQDLSRSPVKVLDIPGDHFSAFHACNIDEITLRIVEGCQYLENFGI